MIYLFIYYYFLFFFFVMSHVMREVLFLVFGKLRDCLCFSAEESEVNLPFVFLAAKALTSSIIRCPLLN